MSRALTWAFAAVALLLAAPTFAADTVYYYSSDTLHSEVVVTDQNRNVVERTHYAPYGQVLDRDLRDGPGYTGHAEDPETGLVYMQQRYYDPEAGRFLSTDPVQADANGGSFNRYWYANDNPYRYTDPDGRESGAGYATGEYTMALSPSSPEARDAALTMAGIVVFAGAVVGADEAVGAGVALRAGVRYVGEKIAGTVTRKAAKDVFTGKGGVKGAEKEFGRASGEEINTGKQDVRVKIRSNGERVEMHNSTGKNPNVAKGTRTIKVQDQNGKVIKTTRYSEPKPPRERQ